MEEGRKEINITIVTDDEKTDTGTTGKTKAAVTVTHDFSLTVMSTLLKNRLISGSFCGGRGDCGRCRIQFITGVTIPTALERSVMTAEELRQGYRLACLSRPKDDCVIRLAFAEQKKIDIISEMIDVPQNNDQFSQLKGHSLNRTTSDFNTGVTQEDCISGTSNETDDMVSAVSLPEKITDVIEGAIAVDLGTTTIAMQLVEIGTGRILDTYCAMNPQRCYGADVLSRIKASCEGRRKELQQMVLAVLEQGVMQFERNAVSIKCMCIAGNTTMEHLLMGYDVLSLGSSPFTPVENGLQEFENPNWDFKVWVTPGISAFVGGDIVAGLYALQLLPSDETAPHEESTEQKDRTVQLLIDLGTNGEMAITDGRQMIVTATAAGPAFEGGAGAGIVGSDMIANTAALLQQGVLDETGLLEEPWFSAGICVGKPAVRLYNKDIRALQMAKAAVRAGIEILLDKMGRPKVGQVYLAGGFGYYLNVEAAFRIGLLPEHARGRVKAVGNTSLAGAYRIGCDLLSGKTGKRMIEERLSSIAVLNLAEQEAFDTLYVRSMNFGM